MTGAIPRSQAGFTIIEVIITTGIFSILLAFFSNFVIQSYKLQTYTSEQGEAVKMARNAVDQLSKEMREMRKSDGGAFPIEADKALAQSIIFYGNIDSDTLTEKVRYFLDGRVLKKGVIKPVEGKYLTQNEVISNVASSITNDIEPIFYYYRDVFPCDTEECEPLSEPVDVTLVSMVNIQLSIDITPVRAPTNYYLSTHIQLRNLQNETEE